MGENKTGDKFHEMHEKWQADVSYSARLVLLPLHFIMFFFPSLSSPFLFLTGYLEKSFLNNVHAVSKFFIYFSPRTFIFMVTFIVKEFVWKKKIFTLDIGCVEARHENQTFTYGIYFLKYEKMQEKLFFLKMKKSQSAKNLSKKP